jgi:NADPH:quinone reductase
MRRRLAVGLTTTVAGSFAGKVTPAGTLQLEAIAVHGRQATGKKYLITPNG